MQRIKRRQFLGVSAGATAAVFLSQCSSRNSPRATSGSASAQVPLYTSAGGLLQVDLTAMPQRVQLGDGSSGSASRHRTAHLLTYNGQVPGPRLEARPGDTVKVHFTNQLDQPTNLHYHGLHIPPTGTADNVFLAIPPGESFDYEFQLAPNQAAGTFWYHPHYHGLVAEQLFGGLAGLFVVRGDLDDIPEIQAAQEEFLVLKDFALDRQGNRLQPGHVAQMTGRIGDLLTANGQVNPALQIPQGGLLRLRLLNAASSRFLWLSLADHPFYLIATDGGAIANPVEMDHLMLAPGERAEVLVRGDREPGQYRLLNYPFNPAQGMPGPGMMGGGMRGGDPQPREGQPPRGNAEVVATLTYNGTVEPLPLPTQLLPVAPLPAPQTVRQFTLNHGMGMGMGEGMGMVFLINGKAFAHDRIDTQVTLDTIEDWEIINTGTMAHPFHVHINDFQVISRNGQAVPFRARKDVVTVGPGETVRIRLPFRDYTGKTVYHCHVLDHEDRGMMGTLDIQPA